MIRRSIYDAATLVAIESPKKLMLSCVAEAVVRSGKKDIASIRAVRTVFNFIERCELSHQETLLGLAFLGAMADTGDLE